MYRLVKKNKNKEEIIFAHKDKKKVLAKLTRFKVKDGLTKAPVLDSVDPLSNEELIKRGGGVCRYCHSHWTNQQAISAESSSSIIKKISCEICGSDTEEIYTLAGAKTGENA